MADRLNRTELHYAAAEGDEKLVKKLLRRGADPCAVDLQGWTPLHAAAQAYLAGITASLLKAGRRLTR